MGARELAAETGHVSLYFGRFGSVHLGIKLANRLLADAATSVVAKLARTARAPIAVLLVELVMMGALPVSVLCHHTVPQKLGLAGPTQCAPNAVFVLFATAQTAPLKHGAAAPDSVVALLHKSRSGKFF